MTEPVQDNGRAIELPMPNTRFAGRIVIASTWVRDEPPVTALLILLNAAAPYYSVVEIVITKALAATGKSSVVWAINTGTPTSHRNINEATAEYSNRGGDI